MNGLLIINKPKGFTSFDVVAVVRRISGERHTGHTGTLDPNATGVLPVCLGNACRLIEYMDTASKIYKVTAKFGFESDTLDIWGNIQESKIKVFPFEDELKKALSSFKGEIDQIPPMYAAIKVNGKKLYQYAREGKTIDVKPRKVNIYSTQLLSYDRDSGIFTAVIECSRGTYIRSITRDLGNLFNCGCIMTDLIRMEAASYTLDDCITVDELKQMSSDVLEGHLLPYETAVKSLPRIELDKMQAKLFLNGNPDFNDGLVYEDFAGESAACFCNERFLGIAVKKQNKLKAYKVFNS